MSIREENPEDFTAYETPVVDLPVKRQLSLLHCIAQFQENLRCYVGTSVKEIALTRGAFEKLLCELTFVGNKDLSNMHHVRLNLGDEQVVITEWPHTAPKAFDEN